MHLSPESSDFETLVQVGLAVGLSALVGIEREQRGRAAGLRTLMLVCLGATLVMIVSERMTSGAETDPSAIRIDPGRVASGIVTGIGFLGGGVIIKRGTLIRGVTTAATIWFVAALGITIGHRDYLLAIGSTVVALVVLTLLPYPERLIQSYIYRTLTLTIQAPRLEEVIGRVQASIEQRGARLMDMRVSHDAAAATSEVAFELRTTQQLQGPGVVRELAGLEGVSKVAWH